MHRLLPVLALLAAACAGPTLSMPSDTPTDFAVLAEDVFDRFVAAFPAHTGCIGQVEARVAWELSDRARYYPGERRVEVRVPATAPQLTASIVHELGHHLEHACPAQLEARPAFLEALDLDPGTEWFGAYPYENDPSELWAEAVVRHVTGHPDTRRPLPVTEAAVEVVSLWAEGGLRHGPASP